MNFKGIVITIFSILSLQNLVGQVQVSDFRSNINRSSIHTFEREGNAYLAESFADNSYDLYQVADDGVFKLIYSGMLCEGAACSRQDFYFKGYVLYYGDNNVTTIDLIDASTVEIELGEDVFTRFIYRTDAISDIVLMSLSDISGAHSGSLMIYLDEGDWKVVNTPNYLGVQSTRQYLAGFDVTGDSIFIYDHLNDEFHNINLFFENFIIGYSDQDSYYFIIKDDSLQLYRYDYDTRMLKAYDLEFSEEAFSFTFRVFNNEIALIAKDRSGINNVFIINDAWNVNVRYTISSNQSSDFLLGINEKYAAFRGSDEVSIVQLDNDELIKEVSIKQRHQPLFIEDQVYYYNGINIMRLNLNDLSTEVIINRSDRDIDLVLFTPVDEESLVVREIIDFYSEYFSIKLDSKEIDQFQSVRSYDLGIEGEAYTFSNDFYLLEHFDSLFIMNQDKIEFIYEKPDDASSFSCKQDLFNNKLAYLVEQFETKQVIYTLNRNGELQQLTSLPNILGVRDIGKCGEVYVLTFSDDSPGIYDADSEQFEFLEVDEYVISDKALLYTDGNRTRSLLADGTIKDTLFESPRLLRRYNGYYLMNFNSGSTIYGEIYKWTNGTFTLLEGKDGPLDDHNLLRSDCIDNNCILSVRRKNDQTIDMYYNEGSSLEYMGTLSNVFATEYDFSMLSSNMFYIEIRNDASIEIRLDDKKTSYDLEPEQYSFFRQVENDQLIVVACGNNRVNKDLRIIGFNKSNLETVYDVELNDLSSDDPKDMELIDHNLLLTTGGDMVFLTFLGNTKRYNLEGSMRANDIYIYNNDFYTGGEKLAIGLQIYKFSSDGTTHTTGDKDVELVSIYPNPSSDWIEISLPSDQIGTFEIIDLQGRIALSSLIELPSSIFKANIESLNDGQYIWRFSNGLQSYSGSFIKMSQ